MKDPLRTLRDSGIPDFPDLKDAFRAVSNICGIAAGRNSMGSDAMNKNRDCERHHNRSVIFLIT